MERPALHRLLAEITAGRIDTVVVYKIDRLTRSLADFAKTAMYKENQSLALANLAKRHLGISNSYIGEWLTSRPRPVGYRTAAATIFTNGQRTFSDRRACQNRSCPKPYELFSRLGWKLLGDLKVVSPSFSVRAAVNRYINARLAAVSTYNMTTPEATLARAIRYCASGACTH